MHTMKNNLNTPNPGSPPDTPLRRGILWIMCLAIAFAMGLAASGSGSQATADPLPDWVNTASNLICIVIGGLILVPRMRFVGAVAAALMMVASMVTNYWVDGAAYFFQVLPFNLVTLSLAVIVARYHRG